MYRVDVSRLTYFLIYEFKLFAPARVNGRGTLAYLDTAANQVTVSPQLADHLPRTGKMTIRSAFGQEEFETVAVEIEFLGNTQQTHARVYEAHDNQLPFQSALTLDARTLFARPMIFDFRLLGLLPPSPSMESDWIEIPSKFTKQGLVLVQFIASGRPIWGLFDTGAGLSVVNAAHLDEMGLSLRPAYEMEIGDATGAKSLQEVQLCSGLYLDTIPLPPFDCFAVDLQSIEEAIGHRIDLIFGANAMLKSGLRWLFDQSEGEVKVQAAL